MDLEQLMDLKVDTVYGASLYAQTTSEAPSSVTIITSEQIKRFGWRTLAEILAAVRSFYLTDDRVYTYLGVRGLQRPGDYNSRVLVLLDGHTTNDNLYGGASFGHDGIVDVALIDRVEIIRGPGSSLYGTGAFFGVVNIFTRTGKDIAAVEAQAGAGSLETHEGRLSFGRRFGNGVDVVLSGSRYGSGGEERFYLAAFDDPATNNGIAEDADGEDAGSLFLRLSRGGFTLEGAYSDRDRTSPSAPYGTVFNTDRTRSEDIRGYLELRYEGKVAEHADLSARVFYDSYRFRGDYLYDYAEEGEAPLLDGQPGRGGRGLVGGGIVRRGRRRRQHDHGRRHGRAPPAARPEELRRRPLRLLPRGRAGLMELGRLPPGSAAARHAGLRDARRAVRLVRDLRRDAQPPAGAGLECRARPRT